MGSRNCIPFAGLLLNFLTATVRSQFMDYGNLMPATQPPQCSEGQERTQGSFVLHCRNGRMHFDACIINSQNIPLGHTARSGQFLMMCKEHGPNSLGVEPVACVDDNGGLHYPDTSGSTFMSMGRFKFDCVKSNGILKPKPLGCVGDQGALVRPGTKLNFQGMVSRCMQDPNGALMLETEPGQMPTPEPWQPVSEVYPIDGNTPTTPSMTTTTYPTWTTIDLNTWTTYPTTETTEWTTPTTETTTQWAPPPTEWAPWTPPTTQAPWQQTTGRTSPPTQQTQNPFQQYFGNPGGFGGPGLVVINNM